MKLYYNNIVLLPIKILISFFFNYFSVLFFDRGYSKFFGNFFSIPNAMKFSNLSRIQFFCQGPLLDNIFSGI
jgi:hypothetical protein